jgi:hypothetical protein
VRTSTLLIDRMRENLCAGLASLAQQRDVNGLPPHFDYPDVDFL